MAQESVTIFLNTTAQTGGIKATVDGLNRVKEGTSALSSKLSDLGSMFLRQVLPAISALTFIRFVNWSITNADAMGKLAMKTGETVQSISALAYSAKLANVSIESLTQASRGLAAFLDKTGQGRTSLTEALLAQADIFAKMPDSLEKTKLAQDRFGRSGADLIPLLNQGREAIKKQLEEAQRYGAVIGPEFAADAAQFKDNLTTIGTIFRGVGNMLAQFLLPKFLEWQKAFIKWIDDTGANIGLVNTLVDIWKRLAGAIASVTLAFKIFGGTQATFLGNLSVTGDWSEAWNAALTQVNNDFDSFIKKLEDVTKAQNRIDVEKAPRRSNFWTDFFGGMAEQFSRMLHGIETFGLAASKVLGGALADSIHTVSNGIWDVVDGTATWGDMFIGVGRRIISNLIEIALTQVVVRGAMMATAALARVLGAESIAMSIAAFVPSAAAGAGKSGEQGGWVGLLIYMGVLAAAIGTITAIAGGFEKGGIVEGGEQFIRVNEAGREAVLNARATSFLGDDFINQLNSGGTVPSGGANGGGMGGGNVTVILVDNEQAMLSALESATGQAKIVRIVRSNKTEIGIG